MDLGLQQDSGVLRLESGRNNGTGHNPYRKSVERGGLDKMVYDDARKEFSLSSMTGFGADGSHDEMKQDFEQVRGDFESNTFVTAVLKHIEDKTALGNELIKRIGSIQE